MNKFFIDILKKRSIVHLFILCFLIIVITLLTSFFTIMHVMNGYTKRNVTAINEYSLQSTSESMDISLNNITRSLNVVGSSDEFKEFLWDVNKNKSDRNSVNAFIDYMTEIVGMNMDNISSSPNIAVYFSDSDYVISTYGAFSSMNYFARLFSRDDGAYRDFMQNVVQQKGWSIFENSDTSRIFCTLHIKNGVDYKGSAVVIAEIDASDIRSIIKNIYDTSETIIFLRVKGTDMRLSHAGRDADDLIRSFLSGKLNHYILLTNNSGVSSIEYCQILKENYFDKVYFHFIAIMIINILLVLTIFGLTLFLFIKYQYKPITDVIISYEKNLKKSKQPMTNEVQLLKMYSEVILETKRDVNEKLSFVALLNSRSDEYDNTEKIKQLGLDQCKKMRVISILPQKEGVSALYGRGFKTENIKTIISNVFEEVIGKFSNFISVYINGQFICAMYDYAFEESEFEEEIDNALSMIKKHFGLKIAVGLGEEVYHAKNINLSYASSREVIAFMNFYDLDGQMFFEDLSTKKVDISEMCRAVESVLKSKDPEKLDDCIDGIIRYYKKNYISVIRLKHDMQLVVSNIRMSFVSKDNVGEDAYARMDRFESFSDYKQGIINCLNWVLSLGEEEDKKTSFKDRIICNYIEENFRNPDLTNAAIADHFDMNPAYLSRIFKQENGKTVTDYVTELRVENAKKMLITTVKTVNAIAEECGFANIHTFIRVFKKYTGTTPGVFRNTNQ